MRRPGMLPATLNSRSSRRKIVSLRYRSFENRGNSGHSSTRISGLKMTQFRPRRKLRTMYRLIVDLVAIVVPVVVVRADSSPSDFSTPRAAAKSFYNAVEQGDVAT